MNRLIYSVLFILSCLFISCAGTAGGDSLSVFGTNEFDSEIIPAVDFPGVKDISTSKVKVVEIPIEKLSYELDSELGKYVYLVRTNPTNIPISSSYVKCIDSIDGLSTFSGKYGNNYSIYSNMISNNRNDIVLKSFNNNVFSRSISRQTITDRTKKWNYGDKRIIWLEDGNGKFIQKEIQLYAISRYCYVWGVPDDVKFGSLDSFTSVFNSICLPVIYLSGSPSNEIFGSANGRNLEKVSMEGFSYTGNMINIVIYDIGNDGSTGNQIGFFSSRDYYPNKEDLAYISGLAYGSDSTTLNYSNEGQYIYIDSWFLKNKYGTTLSTLVHELHHLIVWGNKYMNQGVLIEDCWNEMLSMMCEDLLLQKISEEDSSFTRWDSPAQRLPYFESLYINSGLELRKESSNKTIISYSNLYAFGAWLLRNFGGKQLFSRMTRNSYINENMILEAVNYVNGTNYSMENLLSMFAVSCVSKDYEYTMNKDAGTSIGYEGYMFPANRIDLWNLNPFDFSYDIRSSGLANFNGCLYTDSKKVYELRPYGMALSYLGKVDKDSFSVVFKNGAVSKNQRTYLIITDSEPISN